MAIKFSDYYSTNDLHRKEITVRGITDEVFVRRLPAMDMRRYVAELMSDDINVRSTAGLTALVKAIRDEDGKAADTIEGFKKLDVELLKELIRVFEEVNSAKLDELGKD